MVFWCRRKVVFSQSAFHALGPDIYGVELAFLSVWQLGCSFIYTLWRTGVIKCKYWRTLFRSLQPRFTPAFKIEHLLSPYCLLFRTFAHAIGATDVPPAWVTHTTYGTTYGIETISFLGNRLWSTLPNIIKQVSTPSIFKSHIKCWKFENSATVDFAKYIYHRLGT